MLDRAFWKGRRVFITGHTGFKGSWLCILLDLLGAKVTGFSLEPPTTPSMYDLAQVGSLVKTISGDVTNLPLLSQSLAQAQPDVVFHMAAQPLVRESYRLPVETYTTNVLGTVNLLESVRRHQHPCTVINVTTDKVYDNKEWCWGYRESDALGGFDPYSNSKACSELVTQAYRSSYFPPSKHDAHRIAVATARSGNVIGGGDWAPDRLIPDCARSVLEGRSILVRNPMAIRPWQHVLESLTGYLMLAEKLAANGEAFGSSWNFGPNEDDCIPVGDIVQHFCRYWPGAACEIAEHTGPHEAAFLKLDTSKARTVLGWSPVWNIRQAIQSAVEWYRAYADQMDMLTVTRSQIESYYGGEL